MSAAVSARRGGQPSTTTPTPGQWDSPKVVARNRVPNVLDITIVLRGKASVLMYRHH